MSQNLKSQLESLFFIATRPLTIKEIAKLTGEKLEIVETAVEELRTYYQKENKGIQIIKHNSQFQMVSSSKNSDLIQSFIQDETSGELTRPSLETLTIIAYREPVSKLDLDRIRGVNCSLILRNLLVRGLVKAEKNKAQEETFYSVTLDFLRFLGVNDITELPDYDKLSQEDTIDRILEETT